MSQRDSTQLSLPILETSAPIDDGLLKSQQIFCNRNVHLEKILMLGFDLNHTLAEYRQSQIDQLSQRLVVKQLIQQGYPPSLQQIQCPDNFVIPWLVVDTKLGNLLKTDCNNTIEVAFHGTRKLDAEEVRRIYRDRAIRPSARRYRANHTMLSLCQVAIFVAAVDHLETHHSNVDYANLFDSIQTSLIKAVREKEFAKEILNNIDHYLTRDPDLFPVLHKLRSTGKRIFLFTNSDREYTDAIMTHLMGEGFEGYSSWTEFFDLIITSADKERFFTESIPFFLVQDGIDPCSEILEADEFRQHRIYERGCLEEFHRLTGIKGDRVLHVSSHHSSDRAQTKKSHKWRTLKIIKEMGPELLALQESAADLAHQQNLEKRLDYYLDTLGESRTLYRVIQTELENEISEGSRVEWEAARLRLRRRIDKLRTQSKSVEGELKELTQQVNRRFHPYWGSIFKAGGDLSSFGEAVERSACLYTTKTSHLHHYSAGYHFRKARHQMAHE